MWRFEFEIKWPDPRKLFERYVSIEEWPLAPMGSFQRLDIKNTTEILQRCDPSLKVAIT
jgi:hypothetical protein